MSLMNSRIECVDTTASGCLVWWKDPEWQNGEARLGAKEGFNHVRFLFRGCSLKDG